MDKLKLVAGAAGLGALAGGAPQEDKKWQNYNYPPLLRLVHYSLDGMLPQWKRIARGLNLTVWLVLAIQIVNFVNTCI